MFPATRDQRNQGLSVESQEEGCKM